MSSRFLQCIGRIVAEGLFPRAGADRPHPLGRGLAPLCRRSRPRVEGFPVGRAPADGVELAFGGEAAEGDQRVGEQLVALVCVAQDADAVGENAGGRREEARIDHSGQVE